jgi:hypothetical protein
MLAPTPPAGQAGGPALMMLVRCSFVVSAAYQTKRCSRQDPGAIRIRAGSHTAQHTLAP